MCLNHEKQEYPSSNYTKPSTYVDSLEVALNHLDLECDYEKADAIVKEAIDNISSELREISLDLHANPETGMKEYHAHQVLTDYLEGKGFKVTRHAYGMDTAFTAEYSNGDGKRVGVCSEYDALPSIGQGCGHNLIAICGVAGAIGLKALLEKDVAKGRVVLFGTPAEEVFIGKIEMVNQKAFQNNVDICVMLHPSPVDAQYVHMIASQDVVVEFFGKPSHASGSPWEGVNALDAMVQAYNNISMLRQQLLPTDRVHGIITNGGAAPNIIPDHTSAWFYVRTHKYGDIHRIKTKVEQCFEAAAKATGCQVKYKWTERGATRDVVQNSILADTYAHYMKQTGVVFPDRTLQESYPSGSTDMGNVSYSVPSIHPMFSIHSKEGVSTHSKEFAAQAKTEQAHQDSIRAAKAMTMAAAKVLLSDKFYQAVKLDFETTVKEEERQ
ncbi:uncharacterized protein BX664DRAFT_336189 [Halteromyces radiatus]|uniref:uncharacterized protein n=1 Tax=Halteromyces radiatus TaxID=101107 RepID=UPI00221EC6EC|nr:uncharacterized protein BX664DRAFT_336189 [Halteromyces radiatus]KAI8086578.1 hypothetical protein BX664DRAFT_336189 [Halteromyces radiatus]